MKRFLLKTMLTYILPMLLLLTGIEVVLRSIDNDYRNKEAWMQANAPSVQVLTFGSSHGFYGIRPDCFDKKTYNLGFPSQSIQYDQYLLHRYINKCSSLQTVILPVSYFSLFSEMEDGGAWAHVKGYHIYMGCTYHPINPIYHLELINKEKYLGIAKQMGKPLNFAVADSLGWGYKRQWGDQKPNFKQEAMHTVAHHSRNSQQSTLPNQQRLTQIIETCQQKGINVILLTTPTHPSYYTLLDSAMWGKTQHICEQLDKKYEHVTYLNYLKDSTFTDDDFYDADHLNRQGAAKLSTKLNNIIRFTD